MTFGLRCSEPVCRPHPASLPVRVPTVESLPPASFGFPLAVAPCGSATVAVIGSDWLLSSNKILPMLGTPRSQPPGWLRLDWLLAEAGASARDRGPALHRHHKCSLAPAGTTC